MNRVLSEIVIVGIPFALSVAWCLLWIVRIDTARRKHDSGKSPTDSTRGGD